MVHRERANGGSRDTLLTGQSVWMRWRWSRVVESLVLGWTAPPSCATIGVAASNLYLQAVRRTGRCCFQSSIFFFDFCFESAVRPAELIGFARGSSCMPLMDPGLYRCSGRRVARRRSNLFADGLRRMLVGADTPDQCARRSAMLWPSGPAAPLFRATCSNAAVNRFATSSIVVAGLIGSPLLFDLRAALVFARSWERATTATASTFVDLSAVSLSSESCLTSSLPYDRLRSHATGACSGRVSTSLRYYAIF